MALHNISPSDEMRAFWDTVSQRSKKYEAGKCEEKWASFGGYEGPPLGLGSLARWVQEDSGVPPFPRAALRRALIAGEGWGELLPLDEYELPPFPVDVLPFWLSDFVRDVSTSTQSPPDLCALLVLGTLGAALAGKVHVRSRSDWAEPLNLYVCAVLDPSERKSPVLEQAIKPLKLHEAELRKAARASRIGRIPTLVSTDISPEELEVKMALNGGRMVGATAEARSFFDKMRKSGSSSGKSANIQVFQHAHGGESIETGRITREDVSLDAPLLSLVLATQPDVILQTSDRRDRSTKDQGLLGRFLFAFPLGMAGRRDVDPPEPRPEVLDRYSENVRLLIQQPCPDRGVGDRGGSAMTFSERAEAAHKRVRGKILLG
jgi:hypothetical protein